MEDVYSVFYYPSYVGWFYGCIGTQVRYLSHKGIYSFFYHPSSEDCFFCIVGTQAKYFSPIFAGPTGLLAHR